MSKALLNVSVEGHGHWSNIAVEYDDERFETYWDKCREYYDDRTTALVLYLKDEIGIPDEVYEQLPDDNEEPYEYQLEVKAQ